MTPWNISGRDLEIIKERLKYLSEAKPNSVLYCLEWGSGGSTIEFPKFISSLGRGDFQYIGVEHDVEWYCRVTQEIAAKSLGGVVHVRLEACVTDTRTDPMNDYVSFPRTLNRSFDFIFIDGRKRRRCLIEAAKLLAPGGYAILHDAERTHYHCAFDDFASHGMAGDNLWIGRMESTLQV